MDKKSEIGEDVLDRMLVPSPNYWLLKTEPQNYSYEDLCKEGITCWDGVRNFAARKHLLQMKKGEISFIYHTGEERSIVGVGEIMRTAYPDPTDDTGKWFAVDISAKRRIQKKLPLEVLRKQTIFQNSPLCKQGRLSVVPIHKKEFLKILALTQLKKDDFP